MNERDFQNAAQQEPLLLPQSMLSHRQKISNLRIEKEYQFLKQLSYKYEIEKDTILQMEGNEIKIVAQITIYNILEPSKEGHLSIYIPQEYPFKEPIYSSSVANEQKFVVSHVIEEWVPKLKILQIVELLAKRINEQYQQHQSLNKYVLYQMFIKHLPSIEIVVVLAVLLRVLVGLGSFSGKGQLPHLGDFEAHRNWMSITLNKDITDWYFYPPDETPWWRIDYPPVAAYLSFILGWIYQRIQPESMKLQYGYQSESLKAYMRLTAILMQCLILFPAIILLARQSKKNNIISNIIMLMVLLKPDLILIDHGHFQYNSLILGLILLGLYLLLNGQYYLCCVCYTISLHSKQMAVYYLLAFTAALIGRTYQAYRHHSNPKHFLVEIAKYGLIVITVSLLIWAPFLGSIEDITNVVTAIFPIHRGLYQLKVPNFWCISDVLIKWEHLFSKNTLLVLCLSMSTLLSVPSIIALILTPTKKVIYLAFTCISLTFFMFSYHVHEKSILLPLLIVPYLSSYFGGYIVHHMVISGCMGMYHLLKQDHQVIGYFCILLLYVLVHEEYMAITNIINKIQLTKDDQVEKKGTIKLSEGNWVGQSFLEGNFVNGDQITYTQQLHNTYYNNSLIKWAFYTIAIVLHVTEMAIAPPAQLPYLFHLLFAFFNFSINVYLLILCNCTLGEEIVRVIRRSQKKQL